MTRLCARHETSTVPLVAGLATPGAEKTLPALTLEFFTKTLDDLPFAVTTVRPDGTIVFVNATAAQNLSGSPDEVIGTSLFDYFPERAAATRERIRQTVARRTVQHFEAKVTLPSGSLRFFDSAYCPMLDAQGNVSAVHIVAQDVTELRKSREPGDGQHGLWGVVTDDLSMTSERVEALLENAPILVSVFDRDMTIRYLNRGIAGLSPDDAVGQSPLAQLTAESRPVLEKAFARVVETGQVTECSLAGVNGRAWFVRLAPLLHDGEVKQVLGCTLDTTEQRRLQAHLAHERKVESLGTMASGIAHDFNNLLTAILGNTSLARSQLEAGGDPADLLGEVETAAQRATEICEQMLVYAGRDRRGTRPGELNTVIREMARLTRAAVSTKIDLVYELAESLPRARCERAQLGQVILNLINNAADAIGDQQGQITVCTDLFAVDGELDGYLPGPPPAGRYLRLRVRDSGPGLDADAAQRIFDPFYSTKVAGHGLGLSVVLGIVSANDAAIQVSSELGSGTTMTVLLPICEGVVDNDARVSEAPPPTSGGTILVVDDEKAVRELAATVLSHSGYEVLQASDGDAALELLSRRGSELSAVLLDVTMPGRDGHSTLRELRREHPRLPVLLSSGAPLSGIESETFVGVLPKPYTATGLSRAILRLIAQCSDETAS